MRNEKNHNDDFRETKDGVDGVGHNDFFKFEKELFEF
jgi:hypothetical protein